MKIKAYNFFHSNIYNQINTFETDNKFLQEVNITQYKIQKQYHDLDKPSRIRYIAIAIKTLCKTAQQMKQTFAQIKKIKIQIKFVAQFILLP